MSEVPAVSEWLLLTCSLGITFDVPGADRDCQAYFLWKKREEDTETSGGGAEGEGGGL